MGVFETLRAVSKLTLLSLRNELEVGAPAAAGRAEDQAAAAAAAGDDGRQPEVAAPPAPVEPAEPEEQLLRRDFILRLPGTEFERAETVTAQLKVLDEDGRTLRASQALQFPIHRHANLKEVMVRLNLNMKAEG